MDKEAVRVSFILTDEEMQAWKEACRPVPYLVIGGVEPRSPKDNANSFWKSLATKYNFVWDSVQADPNNSNPHYFTAIVTVNA